MRHSAECPKVGCRTGQSGTASASVHTSKALTSKAHSIAEIRAVSGSPSKSFSTSRAWLPRTWPDSNVVTAHDGTVEDGCGKGWHGERDGAVCDCTGYTTARYRIRYGTLYGTIFNIVPYKIWWGKQDGTKWYTRQYRIRYCTV